VIFAARYGPPINATERRLKTMHLICIIRIVLKHRLPAPILVKPGGARPWRAAFTFV
jgi:hypothetical protein